MSVSAIKGSVLVACATCGKEARVSRLEVAAYLCGPICKNGDLKQKTIQYTTTAVDSSAPEVVAVFNPRKVQEFVEAQAPIKGE